MPDESGSYNDVIARTPSASDGDEAIQKEIASARLAEALAKGASPRNDKVKEML